jgi:hypothetical protein
VFSQFDQTHALAKAQTSYFAANCVAFEAGGNGVGCHIEVRFPLNACFPLIFSAEERQLRLILYSKTVFP